MKKSTPQGLLRETHPELVLQWDFVRNGSLLPDCFSAGSNETVWWVCQTGPDHCWTARICERAKGSRCPFCLNYKVSVTNNLRVLHPFLAGRWHPTKNTPLTPDDIVGTGQHKKHWWICEYGHEWKASIASHIRKNRTYRQCSQCRKVSLAISHPQIAVQWHPIKNGTLRPEDVFGGETKRVWWQCPQGPDHEWQQTLVQRTKEKSGCPYCDGKKLSATNSLLLRFPALADEWHPKKNGELKPEKVFGGGKKKYWWKCSVNDDHEWQASIQKRSGGQGCPVCRGLKVVPSNCLAITNPDLAREWHPVKNGSLTSNNITAGSDKKVVWQCLIDGDHIWEASCKGRALKKSGCPYCNSGWTVKKLRLFVKSLLPYIDCLDPAELYVLLQQHEGILEMQGKGRNFIRMFKSGQFPKEELEKFSQGQPSAVDDYINAIEALDPKDSIVNPGSEFLSEGQSEELPVIETKDILASLDSKIIANADAEAADFFIKSALAKIWRHAFADEQQSWIQLEQYCGEGLYAQSVRMQFIQQYQDTKSLEIPKGYSGPTPNLMQRYIAYLVKARRRIGNWSGTGAGKTLSAILASRVIDARLSVICCPNNVVDTWERELNKVYPDSVVWTKKLPVVSLPTNKKHHYLILHYDFFQQGSSAMALKTLVETGVVDFVVLDEIHHSKQRVNQRESKRRQQVFAFLSEVSKDNKNICVLGMSATPVINELYEGKALIEMVTGMSHDDLETNGTVLNCISLYKKFMEHGIRYVPRYSQQLNERFERVDCSQFIPEIERHKTIVELEKILTKTKMPFILENLRPKTVVYSHYREGIDFLLYDEITKAGWKVGFFNGSDKTGLDAFLSGTIDVLIATTCLATGIDGLQHVCNRLIINCLPWTHAEYKQLIGRIYRQGQVKEHVDIIVLLTYAMVEGQYWSWCDTRWERIKFKKTIADAAIDGVIPQEQLRSQVQAHKDSMAWLARLERGEVREITRDKLETKLLESHISETRRSVADFVLMNQKINEEVSEATHQRFITNPDEWRQYHEIYRRTRKEWPVVPYQEAIAWLKIRSNLRVGDFGCGDAILAAELSNAVVHSFDHVAINDKVVVCDIRRVPLEDGSLDVAVFSLSLMGSNFIEYLQEAHRCLRLDGYLWIAEPTSRLVNAVAFKELLSRLGFDVFQEEQKWKFTFFKAIKTERMVNDIAVKMMLGQKLLL